MAIISHALGPKARRIVCFSFSAFLERFSALRLLQIGRADRAEYFGPRVSFWDALSVELEAVLVV